MRDHTQRENIEKSLEYLQTDYLDLLLIHWPVAGVYKESWKIMEEFYKEGKIRAIGDVSYTHLCHTKWLGS